MLTKTVSLGSSHLLAEEANQIFDHWKSCLQLVVKTQIFLFVCTNLGKLYFRRFYEYEKLIADVLSNKCTSTSAEVSKDTEKFFRKSLSPVVDDQQELAVRCGSSKGSGFAKRWSWNWEDPNHCCHAGCLYKISRQLIALAAPTGKAAFRMRESVLQTLRRSIYQMPPDKK